MHTFPIVGSHYRPPAKALLESLPIDTPLTLHAEPENEHDENAIQVLVDSTDIARAVRSSKECQRTLINSCADCGFTDFDALFQTPSWHLGYIPRAIAAKIKLDDDVSGSLCFLPDGKPAITTTAELPSRSSVSTVARRAIRTAPLDNDTDPRFD